MTSQNCEKRITIDVRLVSICIENAEREFKAINRKMILVFYKKVDTNQDLKGHDKNDFCNL